MRGAGGVAQPLPPLPSVAGQVGEGTSSQARLLLLKYSQSYGKALVRKRLRFPATPGQGVSEHAPLHCPASLCLCQYIHKYHFEKKGTRPYPLRLPPIAVPLVDGAGAKNCCEKLFLTGDQNIADLEAPVYGAGSYPMPAIAYATM